MILYGGQICPKTGSYNVVNKYGEIINRVYIGKGELMPPTQYSDCYYESES